MRLGSLEEFYEINYPYNVCSKIPSNLANPIKDYTDFVSINTHIFNLSYFSVSIVMVKSTSCD